MLGQDVMVEMVRNAAEPRGRDRFSCSTAVWAMLQDLGRTFGWEPHGTTYCAPENLRGVRPARHGYRPGEPLDHKLVDEDDAIGWARALDAARQSAQFDSLLAQSPSATVQESPQTLASLVYEFTEFAYGGAFSFATSAASAPGEPTPAR